MLLSFAYLAFSALLRLLISGRGSEFAKDVELLVLPTPAGGAQPARTAALAEPSRSCFLCRLDRDATDASPLASGTRDS
jgi:hypothetical protein